MDQLNERIKELTTQVALSRKQKEAQVAETAAAQTALREANAEVEVWCSQALFLRLCVCRLHAYTGTHPSYLSMRAASPPQAIAMERRELQQQWSESMTALSKRDDALAALDAAVRYGRCRTLCVVSVRFMHGCE